MADEKKVPTAQEILTDPKFATQKGFLRELMVGIAKEEKETEDKNKPSDNDDGNIFDRLFGGK